MIINIINGILLLLFLIYCYKKPISGIIFCLIVILSQNVFIYSFGFAFGDGEKYLPNITVIVLAYTIGYFYKEFKLGKSDLFDIGFIIYIISIFVMSLYVTEFTSNIGVILKNVAAPMMFYFLGKMFVINEDIKNNYLKLRKYILILALYFILIAVLELLMGINIFPAILGTFGALVGASENVFYFDLGEKYESMVYAGFHRLMGPLLEPTETALVIMIIFVIYLTWTDSNKWRNYRKIMLITLPCLILMGTTRSVILSTGAIIAAGYMFRHRINKKVMAAFGCMALVFLGIYFSGVGSSSLQGELEDNPFFGRLVEERNIEARKVAYEEAWALLKDKILLGVGEGIEVDILPAKGDPTGLTVHNYYLDNLLFKGVLLSAALLVIFIILIRVVFILYRRHGNDFIGNIAYTYFLLTVGMLTFYLASHQKLQIASLFWFYGGMLREIRLQEGV